MADQSDVEVAIQSIVANALYPNGSGAASAIGNTCRIYRGMPMAPTLDVDLAAGVVNISLAASSDVKNTTRYPRVWQIIKPVSASLSVTVAGATASFSGDCVLGQLAGVMVDGAVYPYAVQAVDSPATVASNLAMLIRSAGWIVDYAGSTLTVPAVEMFTARVVTGVGALQEIKRQTQEFEVTLWCPDPVSRDAAAPLIDQALSLSQFIGLADGSFARVVYAGSDVSDQNAGAALFKRRLRYQVEYPTTIAQIEPAMLFGTTAYSANAEFVDTLNI
ncbi:MAG: hypothetical protein P4L54_02315 [Acidocella sp.]|nr:hypothetical protein [Acidocella sp.]